jgi:hypothetical protein
MSDAARTFRVLGLIFALLGLAMGLVVGVIAGAEAFSTDGMLPTTGEVIAYQNRKPVVRFPTSATQTITVVGSTASSPPAYGIGEKLRVYYDPARPQRAVIDTFLERWFVVALLGGFAGLFLLIGIGFLFVVRLSGRRIARLKGTGHKVPGRIVDVRQNLFVRINLGNPWKIAVDYEVNGVSFHTNSLFISKDPRPQLAGRSHIDVWVDPRDPENAWVDTYFLDLHRTRAQFAGPVQRL